MRSCIILCLFFHWFVESHGKLPVLLSPTVIDQEGENVCSSQEAAEAQLNVTKEDIKQIIIDRVNPLLNPCGSNGWTRVAYLNMTDPVAVCPTNWTLNVSPVRGCGQTQTATFTCDSAFFSVSGQSYSRVCGRIEAYQKGSTDAFRNSLQHSHTSIESAYVDGLSLTHGPVGSRQHMWTFVAALQEDDPISCDPIFNCPCTNTRHSWPYQLPPFIKDNYFCDTGNSGPGHDHNAYYSDDPLWDGAGCGKDSTCCQFNNPPWFYSSLPHATTDDVEVRLCHGEGRSDEDIIVYSIEVYVQL